MVRHLAGSRSHVGLFVSLIAAACSAPIDEGEDTVPEFRGGVPAVPGASSPVAANSGANPPAGGGVSSPNGEVIGSNPSSVPVDTGANGAVPASNASGTGGASGAGAPVAGAGGSAMSGTAGAPSTGVGGSGMSGAGGNGLPVGAGGSAIAGTAGSGAAPPTETPPVQPPPPPAAPPPVAAAGCGAGAIFCEDFEALAVGTATGTNSWRPDGGTLSIDSQVAQGSRSLHLQPNGGQFSRIVLTSFAPSNNSFFGRMKVFVQQFPTAPAFSHFVLVEVTGNSGERVRPIGGQFIPEGNGPSTYWGVGADGGATGDWTQWQPRVLTENARWICMEWQMSAADNSVHVFIDGTERPELGVSTNSNGGSGAPFTFPTFNNIWLGWWNFQGGTTPAQFNVWLDDIVLSSERVGCD
jgi:hypothetical protein